MLPHQFRRFIEALRIHARAVEEILKAQERAIRDTAHSADEKRGEIPRIIARSIESVSNEEGQYEQRQRDKEYRQQLIVIGVSGWTALFTALAFGAAAYYASEAHKTYVEIQKQTIAAQCTAKAAQQQATLMTQQLRSTQAAVINIRPICCDNFKSGPHDFVVRLRNYNAIAKDVDLRFNLITMRGNGEIAWRSDPVRISADEILPTAPGEDRGPDRHTTLYLSNRDAGAIKNLEVAIGIDGDLSYWDGFGPVARHVCSVLERYAVTDEKGNETTFWGTGEWVPCDDFRANLPNIMKAIREWKAKQQNHP